MKIAAVVCEYHPFHNGHRHQLTVAREVLGCDAIVGIMSGNFVQRGEPARFPKQYRAAWALEHGMDLALELPATLTLQSAERYARNAVMTLDALGCVDHLFFGAESPDVEVLMQLASVLANEDDAFRRHLQAGLGEGLPFAVARANAVAEILGPASSELLSHPNNILAVEYCKALLRLNSKIIPVALPRKGSGHHDPTGTDGFASGSAIRQMLENGENAAPFLPQMVSAALSTIPQFSIEAMDTALLASLCMQTPDTLRSIADVSEGLEYALLRSAFSATNTQEVIESVKSKRYTYSRIRRILLNAYLGITREDGNLLPSYIRILDFNETGRQVLNLAKGTATLPLAKHGGQIKDKPEALRLWQRELAYDKVYSLFLTSPTKD